MITRETREDKSARQRKACAPRGCSERTLKRTLVRSSSAHGEISLPRAFSLRRRPSRTRLFLATPGCCAPLFPSPSTTSSSSLPRRQRWSTIIGSPGSRRHGTRSCHLAVPATSYATGRSEQDVSSVEKRRECG